jgi:hypothetical protein
MGLANKLNNLNDAQYRGVKCPLGTLIDSLPEEDRQALVSAIESKASTRGIHDALKSENFKIDRQTITLHRKGYCRCKES